MRYFFSDKRVGRYLGPVLFPLIEFAKLILGYKKSTFVRCFFRSGWLLSGQSNAKPVETLKIKAYSIMTKLAKQNQEKALKYDFTIAWPKFLNASR